MNKKKSHVQSMIFVALFATLMCIGAWIHFPSPVPATMQTFVVMCSLGIMGSSRTFLMLTVYIMLGILGLPVFSGFNSGFGALTGPTAGFIWGFLMGVPIFGIIKKHVKNEKNSLYIGYIIYIIIHYIPGALWYCVFSLGSITFSGLVSSLLVTVVPFVLPDAVKMIVAVITVGKLRKALPGITKTVTINDKN